MNGGVYVGRFAPSPTGPLHFGSLVAALASYLDARANDGRWLVRVENIDPPREQPGAADDILNTLERWHLHWDGEVLYQSERVDAYRDTVDRLLQAGLAYRCRCTRSKLASRGAGPYPGTCRTARVGAGEPHAVRLRTADECRSFDDLLQGTITQHLQQDSGDFVIWRRDDLPAYQIAVTLDDQYQHITRLVRGADLLASTPRQNYLREVLQLRDLQAAHLPVAVDSRQQKLGKQTGAAAVGALHAPSVLTRALQFLQQNPPAELAHSDLPEILEWGVKNWNINKLRGIAALETDKDYKLVAY